MPKINEQSFKQIYNKYYPRLASYATFFLKNDEAHDVVQEVFFQIINNNSSILKDENILSAYLYKSVQNKCIDIIRHRYVKNRYSSEEGKKLLQKETGYFYSHRNEIEDKLISKEINDCINNAIEQLPPKGKEILKLYYFHQKTAKEISSILGISQSTVENHIYSAVKTLRSTLTKFIIFLIISRMGV